MSVVMFYRAPNALSNHASKSEPIDEFYHIKLVAKFTEEVLSFSKFTNRFLVLSSQYQKMSKRVRPNIGCFLQALSQNQKQDTPDHDLELHP